MDQKTVFVQQEYCSFYFTVLWDTILILKKSFLRQRRCGHGW